MEKFWSTFLIFRDSTSTTSICSELMTLTEFANRNYFQLLKHFLRCVFVDQDQKLVISITFNSRKCYTLCNYRIFFSHKLNYCKLIVECDDRYCIFVGLLRNLKWIWNIFSITWIVGRSTFLTFFINCLNSLQCSIFIIFKMLTVEISIL